MTLTYLPHLGTALLTALVAVTIFGRYLNSTTARRVTFTLVAAAMLIPIGDFNLSHYARVLLGDLSITGLLLFGLIALKKLELVEARAYSQEQQWLHLGLVFAALLLYPTALGLTYFDLYEHGYYPIILGPLLFSIVAYCIWFGYTTTAAILATGFLAFALSIMDSDNLWDYLIDPIVVIYCLVSVIRRRQSLKLPKITQHQIEVGLSLFALSFLVFAVYLSRANHDAFRFELVIEDGFIEWTTVVVLAITMCVCARRFIQLRHHRKWYFLAVTGLLTLLCLFGAGEEISWGQRIFGIETPEYFKERNAQEELGFHNFVIEVDGEEVKLNKLIFGTGLALGLLIYLFIATPLYRRKLAVKHFFDAIAAPMPRNWQIIGYLTIIAIVELLIDSSKRGEMTEFAGSMLFAMNVIFPYNPEIFDPDKTV